MFNITNCIFEFISPQLKSEEEVVALKRFNHLGKYTFVREAA